MMSSMFWNKECSEVTDYVMIHGAWHGSWCWKRVRDLLTAEGHRVFTPTLTGLGERCHLLSRDVGPDTHIMDVVNLLIWEDLRDIVLIRPSYGGTGVSPCGGAFPAPVCTRTEL